MRRMLTVMAVAGMLCATALTARAADVIDFDSLPAPDLFSQVMVPGPFGPNLAFPNLQLSGGVVLGSGYWSNHTAANGATMPNLLATTDFFRLGDGSLLPGIITGTLSPGHPYTSLDLDLFNGYLGATFYLDVFDINNVLLASDAVQLAAYPDTGSVGHLGVAGLPNMKWFRVRGDQPQGSIDFGIDTLVLGDRDDDGDNEVPEPGALAMFVALGVVSAVVVRRRR